MRNTIFFVISLLFIGCGTVFQGYMSDVPIRNAPDSLKVYSSDGVEIPTKFIMKKVPFVVSNNVTSIIEQPDSTTRFIQLRPNKDQILIFKVGSTEHRYIAYTKLSPLWFTLDVLCAGFPVVFDAVTGNWNYFDAIEYKK